MSDDRTVDGLAIDPQGSGSARVRGMLALWIVSTAHVKLHVYALATLMSLNVIGKVIGS